MSNLSTADKRYLEELLGMDSGYVLNLTNETFTRMFRQFGVNIDNEKYRDNGDSKAKRMRSFWEKESDIAVAKVLRELLELYLAECNTAGKDADQHLLSQCKDIVRKLEGENHPAEKHAMNAPKVFISYSWSSNEHENWVKMLATDLIKRGIDVTLDRFDLKAGREITKFIEQIRSNSKLDKVIIVSDKAYVEKANSRIGGVGAEAQMITAEIYDQQDEEKFILVVTELDENDAPYVPAFYASRLYIDFTRSELYDEKLKELIHSIIDIPLLTKPKLGDLSAYLANSGQTATLNTSTHCQLAISALANNEASAMHHTKQFLAALADSLMEFRLPPNFDPDSDDVMNSIAEFLPYRREFSKLVEAIAGNQKSHMYGDELHSFFEKVLRHLYPDEQMQIIRRCDFDNYRFFAYEMFLHATAVFIRDNQSSMFNALIEDWYYNECHKGRTGKAMVPYVEFKQPVWSLEFGKLQKESRRLSITADLIKERCESPEVFNNLIQADIILYLRSNMSDMGDYHAWYPSTVVYLEHPPLEIFARSSSHKRFASRVSPYFSNMQVNEFKQFVQSVSELGELRSAHNPFCPTLAQMIDLDNLGTRS